MKKFLIISILFVLAPAGKGHAIRGDIDGSGVVDGQDIALLSTSFGAINNGSSIWDKKSDIAGDGIVDGEDLSVIAANFGMEDGFGSLATKVIWGGEREMTKSVAKALGSVGIVRIEIDAPDMHKIARDFPFSLHVGKIDHIPAGTERTITISGLDSSGNPLFRGAAVVTITAGETATKSLYATEVGLVNDVALILAGGEGHSLSLTADGNLWAWGANDLGQLGDGSLLESLLPLHVSQTSELIGVTSLASGYNHAVAVRFDGTVWAWGDNVFGQLGDGYPGVNKNIPVSVSGPDGFGNLSSVQAVAAGKFHSVALKNNGTVWAWGYNEFGQLGDNEPAASKPAPVQVVEGFGNLTGIRVVSAGALHTLALKHNKTVLAWGINDNGQLGDGTLNQRNSATQVQDLTDIEAIVAGGYHSLALKSDGTVWSWGDNDFGQLGDGNEGDRDESTPADAIASIPVQAGFGILSGIQAIAAGNGYSLALGRDGVVWAWGYNEFGQLCNGESGFDLDGKPKISNIPVKVDDFGDPTAKIITIAAGFRHTLLMKSDGTIWACGENATGQLGDGTTLTSEVPVRVPAFE